MFDVTQVKAGDKIANFTIDSIKPFSETLDDASLQRKVANDNAEIIFSGQATIEGKYSYRYSEFFGEYDLIFELTETSYKYLPIVQGSRKIGPIWFSNESEALRKLGIKEKEEKEGNAKITIKNYIINRYPAEVRDTFTLVNVD